MTTLQTHQLWKLPPLILHPFSDSAGPNKLVESSRASMMIQGLLPSENLTKEQLDQKLLDGRFCEIRMLFYVGRDLIRWTEQCMDLVVRDETLTKLNIKPQSFADLLVTDPPEIVKSKLKRWGVADFKAIFSRAFGLNSVFQNVPAREDLNEDFVRNYYRFADHMYSCRQHMFDFHRVTLQNFDFELYASGEYSRMLEREWEAQEAKLSLPSQDIQRDPPSNDSRIGF